MKKETLLLIQQKGNCSRPTNIPCVNCPAYKEQAAENSHCIALLDLDPNQITYPLIYKYAINYFLEHFGTEEDLVEILL